jgi:RNA polymerase sigma-70 factor (ECF subfamily)
MSLPPRSKREKGDDLIPIGSIGGTSWREVMRAVRSYVGRRVNHPEDRDDLVQEILLRIHSGLPDLKARAAPGPWIYGIARNAVVDYWRKRGRGVPVSIDMIETELDGSATEADESDLLQQRIAAYLADTITRLRSPFRETLTLTELQGLRYADAARRLGVSLAAVKSRVLRGREMLRDALSRCCEIELGTTGRVLDCTPRERRVCSVCDPAAV